MAQETNLQKTLVEQILDEMLANLSLREVFDTPTIEYLKQLARAGDLKKPQKVAQALRSSTEDRQ